MSLKNTTILSFIAIFGIGLFVLFFNLLNVEITKTSSNNSKTANNQVATSNTSILPTSTSADNMTKSAQMTEPIPTTKESPTVESIKPDTIIKSDSSTSVSKIPTTTNTNTSPPTPTPVVEKTATTTYKDGNYSASSSYRVPRGRENITVSLTLKNDLVTAVNADNSASDGESASYQDSFNSSLSSKVINKKIDAINLSAVGGASLTTDAFMQALNTILTQAKN